MNRYANRTPEGTRDFLFEECDARRTIETALSALFKSRGYKKVITPTLEFFDVFNRDSSGLDPEAMYSLTDYAGRMLVLRPDCTLPIARIAATRLRDTGYPLRLYYNQRIFRRCPSFSGHSDETTQGGVELIGVNGMRSDLEIISIAMDALNACGAPDFRIELGHAGFFKALSAALNTTDEVRRRIGECIEAKNFPALNDLLNTLGDSPAVRVLRDLPRLFGDADVLDRAEALCTGSAELEALAYLRGVYTKLSKLGLGSKISIDLGLVHRNNYYTGVVFRGFVEGSGLTVLSGGRYDRLIGEFGKPLPAMGFGVEIDALASAMLSHADFPAASIPDVLVFGEDEHEIAALLHAGDLSKNGLMCEHAIVTDARNALEYAKAKSIPRLDVVDASGVRTIKLKTETAQPFVNEKEEAQ